MKRTVWLGLLLAAGAGTASAQERRVELGAHVAVTAQHELDATDVGLGGRVGYRATRLFTVEGELNVYPGGIPDELPVSGSRLEGLFGIKAGPQFGRWSVFGKARPGFVRFAAAPEPIACILIFPPPLGCVLAEGRTVFALDLGGGLEFRPSERSFVRADVSALVLDYPGPSFSRGRRSAESGFWGTNLRFTVGAGMRF